MKIVLTRPYNDSFELKKLIEQQTSHTCVISPLLEIEFVDAIIKIPENAVIILTSANGVRALHKNNFFGQQKFIAIGKATYNEAVKLGYLNVENASFISGNPNENTIIDYIKSNFTAETLLVHPTSSSTKGGVEKELKKQGFQYEKLCLYKSKRLAFSKQFIDAFNNNAFDGFMFFSPRTAAIFTSQMLELKNADKLLQKSKAFCLSKNVVEGLKGINFNEIVYPKHSNTESLINLL